ncbi:double zinc ribbon domain-containing protein [Halomicrobium urmianum]|uniref:double zinc ribbon domain-containing protein n=1 Tax=Halomicrobium urmianum TaxID=1586233 RepID=UPI001CD9439A|nr:zinc ribbon domain-containing protein [Halomicrobium urmianum]
MSKITFRADDDLVDRLEEFDDSKSEVMRRALREFLGESDGTPPARDAGADADASGNVNAGGDDSIDDLLVDRVDAIIRDRVNEHLDRRDGRGGRDVNVNISLDAANATSDAGVDESAREARRDASHAADDRKTDEHSGDDGAPSGRKTCPQCGENVTGDHVYCPNCGEKAARRVFCECGDELRSDWAFCPSCGRRTPAADVLDSP